MLLEGLFEVRERRQLVLAVFVYPPVVNEPDGHGVEEVELHAPPPARDHEARFFEHLEMLHHAEARHLELPLELAQRLPVPLVQQIEQEASRRIAQRLEHQILVDHGAGLYVTVWSHVKIPKRGQIYLRENRSVPFNPARAMRTRESHRAPRECR